MFVSPESHLFKYIYRTLKISKAYNVHYKENIHMQIEKTFGQPYS